MIELVLLVAGGIIAWRAGRTHVGDVRVQQAVRFCGAGHPIALDDKGCAKCKRLAREAERVRAKAERHARKKARDAVLYGPPRPRRLSLPPWVARDLAARDANCTGGAAPDRCWTTCDGTIMHGEECDAAYFARPVAIPVAGPGVPRRG